MELSAERKLGRWVGKDRKWWEKDGLGRKRNIVERGRKASFYRRGAENGRRKKMPG